MTHLLFSYGTLQQRDVQLDTFGRELQGTAAHLVGFHKSMVKIENAEVVKTSGKDHHPIVRQTALMTDLVAGTVFEVTDAELARADKYEISDYVRVSAPLSSGQMVWVYVDARAS